MDKDLVTYLQEDKITFEINENGFCTMKYKDDFYKRVLLLRACPQSFPFEYISVQEMNLNEIGIIEKLEKLDDKSREIAKKELEKRYFSPEITKFNEVKMRPGTTYIDCMFGNVRRNFVVKDVSHNIFYIKDDIARINDSEGNRYMFDFSKLPKKSKKLIEPLLY